MFRRDFPHFERAVFYANAVDRGHCAGCRRACLLIKDHGEHVLLHYHRKARGSARGATRKRKAMHTAGSSSGDVFSHFVPQHLKKDMGALLSTILGSAGAAGVGKTLHHVETHCECACDESSSSEDLNHPKHKTTEKVSNASQTD